APLFSYSLREDLSLLRRECHLLSFSPFSAPLLISAASSSRISQRVKGRFEEGMGKPHRSDGMMKACGQHSIPIRSKVKRVPNIPKMGLRDFRTGLLPRNRLV